jgi:hypothetical protein
MEVFAEQQPPLEASHDLWQAVKLDRLSGLRANEFCVENTEEKVFFVVPPEEKEAREWAIARGYEQPPEEFCTAGSRPQVNITSPLNNEAVPQGSVSVRGQVQLANFDRYEVTFGVGTDPQGWGWVSGPHLAQVADGELTVWDTMHLEPGLYTLRVVAFTRDGVTVAARVIVNIVAPDPTATTTPLPTETPTPTPLLTETPTPTPITPTPETTPTPTSIPEPSPTSQPGATPTSEPALTVAPEPSPTPDPFSTPPTP